MSVVFPQVISSVTGNQECVNDIAASEVLAFLLLVIHMLPTRKYEILFLSHFLSFHLRLSACLFAFL